MFLLRYCRDLYKNTQVVLFQTHAEKFYVWAEKFYVKIELMFRNLRNVAGPSSCQDFFEPLD